MLHVFASRSPLQLIATLLLLLTFVPGCDSSKTVVPRPSQALPLKIVSSFPHRGNTAGESRQIEQGIDLAIDEHAPPPGTARVEHVTLDGGAAEDGSWSTRVESANASMAVQDPQVIAYIGPYSSGATSVALPITNRANLLTMGVTATWPGLTLGGWEAQEPAKYYPNGERNYVRLSLPDSRQAEAAARWAKDLDAQRAYVLDDGSSYSQGLAAHFSKAAGEIGLTVAGQSSALDTSLVKKLEATNADAIYFAPSNVANAVDLAKSLASYNKEVKVFASDTALSDIFLSDVGASDKAWHITFNGGKGAAQRPENGFTARYRAKYGMEPDLLAARAYDLTNLVLQAAYQSPEMDRAALTARVRETKNYPGVSGTISFDPSGDPVATQIEGYTPNNGTFVHSRTIKW